MVMEDVSMVSREIKETNDKAYKNKQVSSIICILLMEGIERSIKLLMDDNVNPKASLKKLTKLEKLNKSLT
ncbi:hypothetical protein HanRHA438_Chr03g0099371 [Helianthus annuus]|nr:hypothetical protein HanRHA438_Chr03g0099371 [Helianthus annuus]